MIEYKIEGFGTPEKIETTEPAAPVKSPCKCRSHKESEESKGTHITYLVQLDRVIWAFLLTWLIIFLIRKMFE